MSDLRELAASVSVYGGDVRISGEQLTALLDERDKLTAQVNTQITAKEAAVQLWNDCGEDLVKAEAERDKLTKELEAVNNEFGCQTATWPNAWERVSQLKADGRAKWREIESLKAERDKLQESLALAFNHSADADGELQTAIAERDKLIADATRYRWLRENEDDERVWDVLCRHLLQEWELDAAIDAAIAQSSPKP